MFISVNLCLVCVSLGVEGEGEIWTYAESRACNNRRTLWVLLHVCVHM